MAGKSQLLKIKLKGGSPWGFRLHGGSGTGLPLIVAKIRRKSKAYNNLKEGDVIININDVPCSGLTYEQVMGIADKNGDEIRIQVERAGSRTENAIPEVKATESPVPAANHVPKTTLITANVLEKEEKHVTEKVGYGKMNEDLTKHDIIVPPANRPDPVPISKETFHPSEDTINSDDSVVKSLDDEEVPNTHSQFPEVISDISSEISTEVTPSSQKITKTETEKFHEKTENKENTFLRTDFEESFKSNVSSTASDVPNKPSESERSNAGTILKEISTKNVVSESYEMFKTEKTEITTTKNNDMLCHFESKNLNSNIPATENISQPRMENLPSLDTDIMSSLNFNNTFPASNDNLDFASSTKKKKMFSSSSFYEEPLAKYPTVEEQFDMAKKIAASLADDTNKKSKGANMFFKRAMRAPKWIHEGPEPSDESFPETTGSSEEPWSPCNELGKKQSPLRLVLDPRHAEDLASLRSTGLNISEHNVVSPDVCHELIRDLESPAGKGSALFAKRKKKSSEWVVDEEKVKSMMRAQEQELNQMKQGITPKPGAYMSQWDSYIKKTPATAYTGTAKRVNPDQLAETVIKAADVKRRDSIQSLQDEPLFETCRSPIIPATPAASYYDIYRARAPKGWPGADTYMPNSDGVCSPSILQNTGYAEQNSVAPYPTAYNTYPKKYNFQNFNTVPRKWRAQH